MKLTSIFQTMYCGAPAPDLAYVDVGFHGDYLTGAPIPHGDYTLVRLLSVPPDTYLFGWSATAPAFGEAVTGIHHPQGSWARVSFGTRAPDQTINVSGSLAPASLFEQVDFTRGIVEPGSSGSPLLNSKAEVVGTLTSANIAPASSVCDINPFPATYGRFSNAYPALAPYLNVDPAPAFSVTPSSLSFVKSNEVRPTAQGITITVQAQTSFVGIPYYLTGVTQVNFIVPQETPPGDQPVTLVVGKTQSKTAYIRVTR